MMFTKDVFETYICDRILTILYFDYGLHLMMFTKAVFETYI